MIDKVFVGFINRTKIQFYQESLTIKVKRFLICFRKGKSRKKEVDLNVKIGKVNKSDAACGHNYLV